MRNNSQNAGCILRFPASHSCHPRRVQWMRAAAAVCESPAASRAARTSSGVGFRAGLPARLRLGWETISGAAKFGGAAQAEASVAQHDSGIGDVAVLAQDAGYECVPLRTTDAGELLGHLAVAFGVGVGDLKLELARISGCSFSASTEGQAKLGLTSTRDLRFGHFRLLPTETRGAVEATAYGSNNTRIAYICKGFLKIFFSGRCEAAKPSNKQ